MLACTETVTFIRLMKSGDEDTYMTTVFAGVSWFDRTRVRTEDTGLVYDNAVQIRIPAALVGDYFPAVGDAVVRGEVTGTILRRSDLEAYSPRKVVAVGDDRRGGLPHVSVIGQ